MASALAAVSMGRRLLGIDKASALETAAAAHSAAVADAVKEGVADVKAAKAQGIAAVQEAAATVVDAKSQAVEQMAKQHAALLDAVADKKEGFAAAAAAAYGRRK